MALAVSPAHAGKADRAREAIAAAEAKIHTAETMGATTEMPREAADARASLALAKDKLARGDKSESIEEAIHASALADTAIGVIQRNQNEALAARSQDATAAQQQAASAQNQAASAQDQAADANARAAAAERSAAASAAQAEAARVAAQTPAQVETTVTTQQPAPRRAARTVTRKTTTTTARRTTVPAPTTTTTTTVKQAVN
jgi:hypothetical protein